MSIDHIPSNVGLLAFAASAVIYLLSSQSKETKRRATLDKLGFGVFVLATLSVSAALLLPLLENRWDFASGILLAACLGWLTVVANLRFNFRSLGTFVAPLATLILMIHFFMVPEPTVARSASLASVLRNAHVTMAILGQAFAICACAIAIVYLMQQNLLKKKLLSQLEGSGPTLNKIDRLLMFTLWCGFVFITLGLLSGAIYSRVYIPKLSSQMEVKVVWAIAVWIWYLTILLARNTFNRSGKRVAQLSVGGSLLLAVSYFGILFSSPMAGE